MFDALLKLISIRKYKIFPISNGIKMNLGMTYIEIIVVLSIFAAMSSVVLFNYGKFQEKVDIKVLANEIALKIVEAQKFSVSGRLNAGAPLNWKPSYGMYFNTNTSNKFVYFADFDNSVSTNGCTDSSCIPPYTIGGEVLDIINITKNNTISEIRSYTGGVASPLIPNVSITFKRPNSGAIFTDASGSPLSGFDYIQITVSSPSSLSARIRAYPSGRIQIN